MNYLEAPDKNEFDRLYQQTIFIEQKIFKKIRKLYSALDKELHRENTDIEWLTENWAKQEFYKALNLKSYHAIKSIVMINYYKNKIKCDENWISDDFKVFPDYTKKDFYNKDWFDYFSDNYFIQISSCFDLIGNILNSFLRLEKEKPDFESVINSLNQKTIKDNFGAKSSDLFKIIKKNIEDEVTNNLIYKQYKVIRNDTIHNLTPSFPFQKPSFIRNENKNVVKTFITPTYLKSKDRIEVINTLSRLFLRSLDIFIIVINKPTCHGS